MTGPRAGSRGRVGSPTDGGRGRQRNSRAASADLAAASGGGTPVRGAVSGAEPAGDRGPAKTARAVNPARHRARGRTAQAAGGQRPADRHVTEPVHPGTSAIHAARQMLARAHWAAGAFGGYDRSSVQRITEAVARAAHAQARRYAEWAVKETGFGVAEHKARKNEACSLGLFQRYRNEDYVSPRTDPAAKILSVPRPAGVILALTPSTNPVCTVFFKVILALLTRNAVVVSPHPMAQDCCSDAARVLAAAATDAGAPDGAIQVVDEPTVELVQALMADPVTDVIVATGGTAMVRAAYRSGNPALGVGPGNVPVLVDTTADLAAAAARIAESKAFDNSLLCTNESVLIAPEPVADRLTRELAHSARSSSKRTRPPGCGPTCSRTGCSTARRSARTRPGSPNRPGSGCRHGPRC
ncbi:MAG: aldehyde dehydrogenase family protein [Streptosporangiaceae bacterium]